MPSRPRIAIIFGPRWLLGLGNGGAVAQSQPPPRAKLCIRTQPVGGGRCGLRFGCGSGFDRRAAIVGAFRAFLRSIGRIAGFVLKRENSSHPFERIQIGKIRIKCLRFFCIFCIDSRSAGLKLPLDPIDIVGCKVPHESKSGLIDGKVFALNVTPVKSKLTPRRFRHDGDRRAEGTAAPA